MGFKVPRRTIRLIFEGDEYDGCEVVCGSDVSFEALGFFQTLDESATSDPEALRIFADSFLISWNIEGADGEIMPCDGEHFLKLPYWFAFKIMEAWKKAMTEEAEVPAPLGKPSRNGGTSRAATRTASRSRRRQSSSRRRS